MAPQAILRLLHPILLHKDLRRLPWRPAGHREVPSRDHERSEYSVEDPPWVHCGPHRPVSTFRHRDLLKMLTSTLTPAGSKYSSPRPRFAASSCSGCGCRHATLHRLSHLRPYMVSFQVRPQYLNQGTYGTDLAAGAFVSLLPTYIATISPREKLGARLGMLYAPRYTLCMH